MSVGPRIDAVRAIIAEMGVDAILITNPTNRRYLTGFTADDHAADESSGVVLVTRDAATLFVSPTNLPWAMAEIDADHVNVVPYHPSRVAQVTEGLGTGRLAVEDATTPAADWFALQDALDGRSELARAGDRVDRLRSIKTEDELGFLREAARLTDQAFELATARFAAGITERQGVDLVREALREVGSDGEGFEPIVAAGPNAAKPHHRPGDHALQPGEPIIIDMGAHVNGYNGDMTRTICLGTADERLIAMYDAVYEAQQTGLRSIRAGVAASAPDAATRKVFASHGLEQHVIHSAGHGLGLRVHETPSLRASADDALEAGQVVTMEPGLYIAGWGGVRIEDVAIVLADGHENITSAPKGVEALQR